jgi:hypothetical protein
MERSTFLCKRLLQKTALCVDFHYDVCELGDSCDFAHGPSELRRRPVLVKTSLCSDWQLGCCNTSSKNCIYAHGRSELSATSDVYKTKLCFAFRNKGSCTAGKACRYAHGPSDIRSGCMTAASPTDMHDTFGSMSSSSTSIFKIVKPADGHASVEEPARVSPLTTCPGPLKLMTVTDGIALVPAVRIWTI